MKSDGDDSKTADEREPRRRSVLEIMLDPTEVDRALKRGVREALLVHKKLGTPIVVWQDGKVVEIAPEDIPV